MEGVSVSVYNGIKEYLKTKRSGYERITRPGARGRKCRVELGGGRKEAPWRIKLRPKLKLRINLRFSPKKLLLRLRDAYVGLMLRVSNTRAIGGFAGNTVSDFTARSVKEYDERMIIQIYKSLLIAHGQTRLASADAPPRIGTSGYLSTVG
ncbi:unnamed protein product [Cuscuta campestris]|uniref:Uncharacterized protein n=2 Tax=Cuscuta sect. Cleistogrammica TaxID=1824901 RepID=A0A484K748_9ASTE|nr:hypothetical protein DM860_011860 [Cuscuta australis]VFQ59594.1 unnamed protein product [Cuscuta campestris]